MSKKENQTTKQIRNRKTVAEIIEYKNDKDSRILLGDVVNCEEIRNRKENTRRKQYTKLNRSKLKREGRK